jgi:hypothetical protein
MSANNQQANTGAQQTQAQLPSALSFQYSREAAAAQLAKEEALVRYFEVQAVALQGY